MKPYSQDVVNLRAQVQGYTAAVDRFRTAAADKDAVAAYQPLFESLSWVASIDYRIADLWAPKGKPLGKNWYQHAPGATAVPGLRWARNTVHHDWANALNLETAGRRYPARYPKRYFEWLWRPVTELPANKLTNGKAEYSSLLDGQAAEFTLQIMREVFDFVVELVEPIAAIEQSD